MSEVDLPASQQSDSAVSPCPSHGHVSERVATEYVPYDWPWLLNGDMSKQAGRISNHAHLLNNIQKKSTTKL